MKTRTITFTLIVALMSLSILPGCQNNSRADAPRIVNDNTGQRYEVGQTNTFESRSGGLVGAVVGDRVTGRGDGVHKQPDAIKVRKGGFWSWIFGDTATATGTGVNQVPGALGANKHNTIIDNVQDGSSNSEIRDDRSGAKEEYRRPTRRSSSQTDDKQRERSNTRGSIKW